MKDSRTFSLIVEYVNKAADLAEAVQQDIQRGRQITTETVHKLAKFHVAAREFEFLDKELTEQLKTRQ